MFAVLLAAIAGCGGETAGTTRHVDARDAAASMAGGSGGSSGGGGASNGGRFDSGNPVFCQFTGGHCLIGGSHCSAIIASIDCNPDQNPGGAFCCLDPPVSCTDANVQIIAASNYDQSCNADSDCIAVGEGNACSTCAIQCTSAAINASAKSRYDADVAKTLAGPHAPQFCGCPAASFTCCIGGVCRMDVRCSPH